MPDGSSDDAQGGYSPYTLPSAYGPTLPSGPHDELDQIPTVTVHDRDTEIITSPPAAATNHAAPVELVDDRYDRDENAGMSRHEIQARRKREEASVKQRSRGAKQPRSPRAKWIRRGIALVVVVLLVPVAISYVDYLNQPGTDSLSARTVGWIRDNGANGLVNAVERWWYTNNPPAVGGAPDAIETQKTVVENTGATNTTGAEAQIQHLAPPIKRVPTPAADVQENEGVWQPTGRLVAGIPAVYTTYVRPDAIHTSYYAGVMWLDTKLLRTNYVVGLEQPGGGPNPWGSKIPRSQVDDANAAFNSGFTIDTANGGAYLDGQEIAPLRNGAASLVIMRDGTTKIGAWDRDFSMSRNVEAVRQNLVLIVDRGRPNPEMHVGDTTAFGEIVGNNVAVWRSGVGITDDGALVYVGGPAMSLTALARTLQAAGAVRAMELDVNAEWVSAFTYRPNRTVAGNPVEGVKLLDEMAGSTDRYLDPSSRDFFALTADPKAAVPTTTTTTTK